ncbi:MAG: TolC family protein [Gemmatimonadota bacterium]
MMNRVLLIAITGWVWSAGLAVAQGVRRDVSRESRPLVLSLREAEELAFRNNPAIKAATSKLRLSRAKRASASHARFLPKSTLRNVWGPIPRARGVFTETGVLTSPDTTTGLSDMRFFTEVDVDLVQPIWTFGKLGGLRTAAESGVDAAAAEVTRSRADVQLQIRKAYWGLVLGYELLKVVEDAQAQADTAENKLQELFDQGSDEVSQNDLFKFRIFGYEIGKQHREALDRIELGKAALRAAMGLDPTTDLVLETEFLDPLDVELDSLPAYTALALRSRPEISQLDAGIAARSAMLRVARSDYLPQFFFGAQIKFNRAPSRFDPRNPFVYNPTNFFRPGFVLGLNWNFNIFQTRDRARIARFELAAISQQEEPLRAGIRLDVRKAYLRAKQAKQNIEESRGALKASDNWLRAELQTFDLGVGDVKDVIEAFRANSTMKTEYLKNVFELNSALAELSRAVGRDLYPR